MKKCIGAAVLLVLLLAGGLLNVRYLDGLTGELVSLADAAMALAEAGDFPAAAERAEAAAQRWAEADGYTHVFVRHTEIDSTTDAFCDLLGELYAEDAPAARGAHRKLREHLTSIAGMEHITFGSIF